MNTSNNKIKKSIYKSKSNWNFKNISSKFEDHITRSIPLYDEAHQLIVNYSDFFLSDKSIIYDIGISTGNLAQKILSHTNKRVKYYGVEIEKTMALYAKKKLSKHKNVKIINKDIKKIKLEKSSFIISSFTLQFQKPATRLTILKKIYKSLEWGGAFIYFEKVRAEDARFQDYATLLYNEFKLKNKFDEKEVIKKSLSLKGVMEPYSEKGNRDQLKAAGFKDISTIFKYLCFQGFLCIK